MDIQDRNLWKQAAGERLAASFYDPRRLVAIHTGVAIGVSLVATLVSHLLDRLIAQTVGLGGLSTRVNLESIRMLVILLPGLLTIFWDAGYRGAMLRIGRGEAVMPRGLLEGFQSFWPLLRHALLRGLLGIPVGMLCWYAAEILFLLTPFSAPMLEALAPVMESGTLNQNLMLDPAVQEAMLQAAVPLLVLFGLLLAAGLVLVYFPMRMSVYALLEEPEKGALFCHPEEQLPPPELQNAPFPAGSQLLVVLSAAPAAGGGVLPGCAAGGAEGADRTFPYGTVSVLLRTVPCGRPGFEHWLPQPGGGDLCPVL